jgi:hypothetical protein
MPALRNKTYFNYGGQGPLPNDSLASINAAWATIQELGPFSGDVWPYVARTTDSLRQRLAESPDDPQAAAGLGALLLKRQECTEAGRWLRAAYNKRDDLPDGGRRVRMQLRELSRRVAQRA